MKKKFLTVALLAIMAVSCLFVLTGCGKEEENKNDNQTTATPTPASTQPDGRNLEVDGENLVMTEWASGIKMVHTFRFENDIFKKADLVTYFNEEAEAKAYKETLEAYKLYDNFKIEGTTVTCDYAASTVAGYKGKTTAEVKTALETLVNKK